MANAQVAPNASFHYWGFGVKDKSLDKENVVITKGRAEAEKFMALAPDTQGMRILDDETDRFATGVNILTVKQVKGLEFLRVYVYDCNMSDNEKRILKKMKKRTFKMYDYIFNLEKANAYNNEIDENTQEWRDVQIQGLKDKSISSELGIAFSRILTDYDRINDHALNLAEEINKIDDSLHETMLEDDLVAPYINQKA